MGRETYLDLLDAERSESRAVVTIARMSPVSRGRKPKKKAKKKPGRRLSWSGVVERPGWFDAAINGVLDGAAALETARGPRELEQLTCELLGAQLHRVLDEGHAGLRFSSWFEEVGGAARKHDNLLLLHGLAAIGDVAVTSDPDGPAWLGDLLDITATGEVFRMRDAFGTRFAVIAGFSYGPDPFVYLFDIDASESARLVSAGVFDDVDQAAAAWRADVGDAAEDVPPRRVVDAADLMCLAHLAIGDQEIVGDEPRVVMDNWFRAQRRLLDLGTVVPPAGSLYRDVDSTLMVAEFTAWYSDRRGADPDPDALAALAEQWTEGALPETWYSVSPSRIAVQYELIGDWLPDDPVTLAARALLPDWVAWLSERAKLPDHLRERVAAAVK